MRPADGAAVGLVQQNRPGLRLGRQRHQPGELATGILHDPAHAADGATVVVVGDGARDHGGDAVCLGKVHRPPPINQDGGTIPARRQASIAARSPRSPLGRRQDAIYRARLLARGLLKHAALRRIVPSRSLFFASSTACSRASISLVIGNLLGYGLAREGRGDRARTSGRIRRSSGSRVTSPDSAVTLQTG